MRVGVERGHPPPRPDGLGADDPASARPLEVEAGGVLPPGPVRAVREGLLHVAARGTRRSRRKAPIARPVPGAPGEAGRELLPVVVVLDLRVRERCPGSRRPRGRAGRRRTQTSTPVSHRSPFTTRQSRRGLRAIRPGSAPASLGRAARRGPRSATARRRPAASSGTGTRGARSAAGSPTRSAGGDRRRRRAAPGRPAGRPRAPPTGAARR